MQTASAVHTVCTLSTATMSVRIPVLKEPVLPVYVQFSRDKYIMEGPPEKLRKELEDELKLGSEEPRSHAWYHGAIPRQVKKKTHSHSFSGGTTQLPVCHACFRVQ